tara:strand:+ start:67 stop:546 length:480 start_codon:yes stop_codon:yes gene_type:complete
MNYKIIEGYEDYRVYENGDVFNVKHNRFMKQYCAPNGYLMISVCKDGKKKNLFVHKLIGLFIPNPENKPTVDHINRNKKDNRLINLRWATKREQEYNKGLNQNNTSGFKGVHYQKRRNTWMAELLVNGKKFQKQCKSKEYAIVYRRELEIKYLGKDCIV